jgi:uncharacterized membrane protein
MRNVKLSKLWDALHSSYWFIPTVMVVAAIALAFTMLWFDRTGQSAIEQWWWIYTGGADGARSLLEAVAGSMISISATAFSITIVALQLAASNFGPRLSLVHSSIACSYCGQFMEKEMDTANLCHNFQ